jgi:hypothetical protein
MIDFFSPNDMIEISGVAWGIDYDNFMNDFFARRITLQAVFNVPMTRSNRLCVRNVIPDRGGLGMLGSAASRLFFLDFV